jgi:hypothetical protein
MMLEPLIDANQAAAILKVHPVTIREMATAGTIPALNIGRCGVSASLVPRNEGPAREGRK